MKSFLFVFLGGGVGSVCRFTLGNWLNQEKYALPYGTLTANILGSFIIGFLLAYAIQSGNEQPLRNMAITGFCGGFTTMAAFSAESIALIQSGRLGHFFVYVALTIMVCMLATAVGLTFVKN